MSELEQFWKRTIHFLKVFFRTASALATALTIVAFLSLSATVLGILSRAIFFVLIGGSIFLFTGVIFILFYTLLKNIMSPATLNSNDSSSEQLPLDSSANSTKGDTSLSSSKDTAVLPVIPRGETIVRTDTISYPPPPSAARQGQGDVAILRKEIVYEYLTDAKTMYQRKHLQIQALQETLAAFTDRYRWSGNGTCNLRSLTKGFEVTNQYIDYEGMWTYFDVHFPFPLHRGETYEFTIEWILVDETSTALPFLSTMIDRETQYLLLEVKLPEELAPTRATFHEYANYIDTLPSFTKRVQWSPATKSIRYDVIKPERYHKYLIRWYRDSN